MNNQVKKILSALLVLVLLSSLSLPFFASEQVQEENEAEWSLSDDEQILSCKDERYQRLPLSSHYLVTGNVHHLGIVQIGNDSYYVGTALSNTDLHLVYEYVPDIKLGKFYGAYYSVDALEQLDGFLNGQFDEYLINNSWYVSSAEADLVKNLENALDTQGKETDVTLLSGEDSYDLWGTDEKNTLVKRIGTFFDTSAGLYYVDLTTLSNDRFDSEGNLSTREGTVRALLLDETLESAVKEAMEEYTYRKPDVAGQKYGESPALYWGLLLVFGLLFGFFTPLLPLIFSIVQLVHKKTLHPRRYIALAVLSVLWMLLVLIVSVVTVI